MRALDRPAFDDPTTATADATDAAADLRSRIPAQSLIEKTLLLHGASLSRPTEDAGAHYAAAVGGITVAGVLSLLSSEWTVLHSVPVGGSDSDIDHVVIGPPGIFTISSKNHAGQRIWIAGWSLFVSGHATPYIVQAEADARRAADLLSDAAGLVVPVRPLVVLVSPGERRAKSAPEGGVRVVADGELLAALHTRREFSNVQLERIVAAAVSPRTWRSSTPVTADARTLAIRFNAIVARTEVAAELGRVATPGARAIRRSSGSIEALAGTEANTEAGTEANAEAGTEANTVDDAAGHTSPGETTSPLSRLGDPKSRTALGGIAVIGIGASAFLGVALPILQATLFR